MFDIDKIMDMIDWNNSIEIQEKGIELAKNVKCINVFILPKHSKCNKNVWENCAKILAGRTDKELVPYLTDILLWIEDMNWPGAMIILERMKKFSDVGKLSIAIQETIRILDASNRENREIWLMTLSELLDNEKLEKELPINTLSELKRYYYKKEDLPKELHPGVAASIYIDNKKVGIIGKIHPNVTKDNIFVIELNVSLLKDIKVSKMKYKEISKFPGISKDIAFVLDKNITSEEVIKTIKKAGGKLLTKIEVFDLYVDSSLGENNKSLAFSLYFEDPNKTLTLDEITEIFDRIAIDVEKKHNAKLRNN